MAAPNPFVRATYRLAAHEPRQLPPDLGREVAFAGRSNAGKSSALNALCQQNALARVSKTPGRTQQLVFFDVAPPVSPGAPPAPLEAARWLVDLPGYGYAKVPQDLQAHWQAFIERYFETRQALRGLVVVMDIRHPMTDLDLQMLGWCEARGLPTHILLTKADKLGHGAGKNVLLKVQKELRELDPAMTVQTFSAHAQMGAETVRAILTAWLEAPASGDQPV